MIPLNEQNLQELKETCEDLGLKKFRAKQLFHYFHKEGGQDLSQMTTLAKNQRQKLMALDLPKVDIEQVFPSKIDKTKKFLFHLKDGHLVEGVLMDNDYGLSQCISSQVGCRMGCSFCASTKEGRIRNLTPYEMLGQVYEVTKKYGRLHSIILMGSGEPLDNYDNVMRFLDLLHDENGYNLSYRNMTLSTCGVVPGIKKLAQENKPINLAISLHTPFQEDREKIMAVAKKYSLEDLFKAIDFYQETSKRRVSYEYTLIDGVNNREKDALELKKLLGGRLHHLNLIPLNPIQEYKENRPSKDHVRDFQRLCTDLGLNVTLRREQGGDIQASCGQLRRKYKEGSLV